MKDVRVEFKFKNAVLYNALHDRFQTAATAINGKGLGCIVLAAKLLEVEYAKLLRLVNLKESPRLRGGAWRPIALKVSAALDSTPDALFPAHLYTEAIPSNCFAEIDSSEMMSLASRVAKRLSDGGNMDAKIDSEKRDLALRSTLQTLSPREEIVIKMRFGLQDGREYTLDEIGQRLSVSGERIRHIEARGLRKMRHPDRSMPLRQFAHVSA